MKIATALLTLSFAAAALAPASALLQAEELPDSPQATAAALTTPNGPKVIIETSMGRLSCQFYQKQAPIATSSFIGLAEGTQKWRDPVSGKLETSKRYFDGLIFHRVIPGFMIQGGDPTGTGAGGPGYSFKDEVTTALKFDRPGRMAMANSGPNTNGGQFFITEVPYPSLNMHYTIFGQCDSASVEVVKAIARTQRDSDDRPLKPVVIQKVTIVREDAPAK